VTLATFETPEIVAKQQQRNRSADHAYFLFGSRWSASLVASAANPMVPSGTIHLRHDRPVL